MGISVLFLASLLEVHMCFWDLSVLRVKNLSFSVCTCLQELFYSRYIFQIIMVYL